MRPIDEDQLIEELRLAKQLQTSTLFLDAILFQYTTNYVRSRYPRCVNHDKRVRQSLEYLNAHYWQKINLKRDRSHIQAYGFAASLVQNSNVKIRCCKRVVNPLTP